jgi:hypothetical protein
MKITKQQLQLLIFILSDTLSLNDRGSMIINREERMKLFDQIMNQQSDELIDVE